MANAKISALPAVTTPVAGTAQIPVVQSGVTKVATAADIRNAPEPFVMTAQATGSVTAAAAGTVKMFSRSYAGRVMPEFMNEAAIDCFVQPAMFNNNFFIWTPSNAAVTGTMLGNTVNTAGTVSHPTLASTNMQTSMRRTEWVTTAAASQGAGIRGVSTQVWRGNAANLGGFFAFFRFTQNSSLLGHMAFVGLASSTAALTANPSALPDMIGIGFDSGDTVANGWQLMRNDASGTATKVALGASGAPRDTSTVLDLTMYCPANSSQITCRVYNQTTQSVVLDNVSYTTDLPTNTAFLTFHAQQYTGAVTTLCRFQLNRIYIDSDI